LTGVVEEKLKEILFKIADENGFTIEAFNCDQDHVHLLINCKPQHYIPNFIKALKGVSGRFMFENCPWLKDSLEDSHLWNPGYFVFTGIESAEAEIRAYIQSQKEQ
jgi:putative transposase